LEVALRTLIAGGLRRVLIAGSADTGLLALVARAGADHGAHITVLDICESPLELCRQLASQWSLQIETLRQDLRELHVQQQFDLVLVHGTLHFIAADGRLDALARILRALHPDGRVVLLFNTSKPSTVEIDDNFHIDYAKSVVSELKRLGISLPDNEEVVCARLSAHSRQRQLREGAFAKPDDATLLLETAGFNVISCSQVDVKLAGPARNFVSHISKRRFMTIAERSMRR
jgi:SAM-dependent methyltransferase